MKRAESLSKGDVVALELLDAYDCPVSKLYRVISHDLIQGKAVFIRIGKSEGGHTEKYLTLTHDKFNEVGVYVGRTPVWWKRLFKKYDS